jgi:hypothetical protein
MWTVTKTPTKCPDWHVQCDDSDSEDYMECELAKIFVMITPNSRPCCKPKAVSQKDMRPHGPAVTQIAFYCELPVTKSKMDRNGRFEKDRHENVNCVLH